MTFNDPNAQSYLTYLLWAHYEDGLRLSAATDAIFNDLE